MIEFFSSFFTASYNSVISMRMSFKTSALTVQSEEINSSVNLMFVSSMFGFQLTDKIGIVMKYPTFEIMQKASGREDSDIIMDLIYNSIEQVYDEDTVYHMKDSSKEEIIEFIDNLQQKDLENIRNFFDTMPKLQKKIEYKCRKCGYQENIVLEGVQSFFE
jgi:lipopolysaccharide biosynthesis regulator YciM